MTDEPDISFEDSGWTQTLATFARAAAAALGAFSLLLLADAHFFSGSFGLHGTTSRGGPAGDISMALIYLGGMLLLAISTLGLAIAEALRLHSNHDELPSLHHTWPLAVLVGAPLILVIRDALAVPYILKPLQAAYSFTPTVTTLINILHYSISALCYASLLTTFFVIVRRDFVGDTA